MRLAFLASMLLARAWALLSFQPGAFMIRRQCGQLGFATETEWQYGGKSPNPLDPTTPKRTVEASGISVRLFDAKLGDGTRVLLKEYIGDEPKALAGRELDTYELLYKRATDAGQRVPSQVGQLLGVMTPDASFATEAFRTEWSRALPNVPPPAQNAVWLVFQWEGLRTVAGFPSFPQERSFFDFDGRGALADRRKFVKAVCAQTLETLRWLHGQGVVHRSLGSSSIILSTYDQREPPAIKLIDLGFAVTATALGPDDIKAAMARGAASPLDVIPFCARADDLHALAYVLLELCFTAASTSASTEPIVPPSVGSRPTDLQSMKRLVEDVFAGDVRDGFRRYCAEEAEWAAGVEWLDEKGGAGWELVQKLVDCRDPSSDAASTLTAQGLLESPWLDGA